MLKITHLACRNVFGTIKRQISTRIDRNMLGWRSLRSCARNASGSTGPVKSMTMKLGFTHSNITTVPLVDKFNRSHDYLRISLTERCNLRCTYCMPEEGVKLTPVNKLLTLVEIKKLASLFVKHCGIKKIRLTGGEPSISGHIVPLLSHLNTLRSSGLETVAMTTNGLKLFRHAHIYKESGLNAINISLDSLREERYLKITRQRGLPLVIKGIMRSLEIGFDSIKVNCVVMRGVNDDEVVDFARLAMEQPIQVRFIEFMPFYGNEWSQDRAVPYRETLGVIKGAFPSLVRIESDQSGVSKIYKDPGMKGSIGFISSMSDDFCGGCNRLRITSDGQLRVCLFGKDEVSLRDLLRAGASESQIVQETHRALQRKKYRHADSETLLQDLSRPMIKIATRSFHSSSPRSGDFSHLDELGKVRMVNVSKKQASKRKAIARGSIVVGNDVILKLKDLSVPKGDVITVSKVAGIMGAKQTSQLIPLCHQVKLDSIHIEIEIDDKLDHIHVTATTEARDCTGVEMESLTACSITLLSLYDMCKSVSKLMHISEIRLLSKTKDE